MRYCIMVFSSLLRVITERCTEVNTFSAIDELLLQLYVMYEKSPKQYAQLDDRLTDLKACLEPDYMPSAGGHRSVCPRGTRFVAHNVPALGRLIDCHGAYINHLNTTGGWSRF